MNYIIISKKSLKNLVKFIIETTPDIRLHNYNFFKKIFAEPIKIKFISSSTIYIYLEIDIKFGISITNIQNEIINNIKNTLFEKTKIQVRQIFLIIRDVFYEKSTV